MADPRRSGIPQPFETPLLSSRTLHSAAATAAGTSTVGSSRLPLRRPSISGAEESHVAHGVTMTAGRLPALRRPSSAMGNGREAGGSAIPSTASRLPTRRPSLSGGDSSGISYSRSSGLPLPSTASRPVTTLKRTSSAAGLQQDSEATATKRQLSRALHDIEELKHTHERQMLEAASTQNEVRSQIKEYAARTERLERHRALLMGKERELEEREQERRQESDKSRAELQGQVRTLRQELSALKDQHAEMDASYRDLEHSETRAAATAKAQFGRTAALEKELERARQETAAKVAEIADEREQRRMLEAEIEKLQAEERESANAEVVKEELHRQVAHLRTLEKENGKLVRKLDTYEKQHANVEILKEANKTLEKKLRGLDDLRKQTAAAEAEAKDLKREKREWLSFLGPSESSEFSSPRKLTKTLAATRIENATFRERMDSRELEIQQRDRMIGELEARTNSLTKELDEATRSLAKAEARSKQDGNRLKLLHQEVEMLKRHLATYSTEEANNQAGNFDEQKTARLVELETLLDAHKQEVSELSKQVAHWRGLVERYGGSTTEIVGLESRDDSNDTGVIVGRSLEEQLRRNEAMQQEIDELRNENLLMEKEIEALELQNDRLTYEHGNGAYDPRTTRVLELRENPDLVEHAIRTSALERLRDENQALLHKIGELELRKAGGPSNGEGIEAMVPRQSFVNLQADLEASLAVVKQKETMELRLKQAFSDKADEFRKVVLSLLGYRLDFLSSGRVKVSSAYAPSKDHSLLFSSSAGGVGTMELVGAGSEQGRLSDEVRRQVKFWVGERQCIPGFLASLTLTMFEESTKGGAAGFVTA